MQHTSDPASTGRGRPPLAVWPCAPHTHHASANGHGHGHGRGQVVVPGRLAHRLVVEYTRPGAVVADLTRTRSVAEHAERAGRTFQVAATFWEHEDPATLEAAWADLAVAALPATSEPDQVTEPRMRAQLVVAATITRPGGIVAFITGVGRTPTGAIIDPAPGLARAAACADLVYLQHIIALTAPICGAGLAGTIPVRGTGGFEPGQELGLPPDQGQEGEVGLAPSVAQAAATVTSPAHLNVSVFRAKGQPGNAGARGQVSA